MIRKLALLGALLTVPVAVRAQEITIVTNVCIMADSTIDDVAYASFRPSNCPSIRINPRVMRELPISVQLFILYHELAHLDLRHDDLPGEMPDSLRQRVLTDRQLAADCYAAQAMNARRPDMMAEVLAWFANPPVKLADLVVPPLADRAAKIKECIQ